MKAHSVFAAALWLAAWPISAPTSEPETTGRKNESGLATFLESAEVSGVLYSIYRVRDRKDVVSDSYKTNLDHLTAQAALDFNASTKGSRLNLELGVFGAYDAHNSGSPDHEMNFFPWDNPWSPDWSATQADNGTSLYKANLRLQGETSWLRLGMFQPQGPGVLGVNYSFLPGTYLGGETGLNLERLSLTAAWVTQYKAPWFNELYNFQREDDHRVEALWSLGARYIMDTGLSVELAYGQSLNYLENAHLKIKYLREEEKRRLYLTAQVYLMDDNASDDSPSDLFNGLASHYYLASHYTRDAWILKLEGLHTEAPTSDPNDVGYFAYRLTGAYGGSNGAYEPWWYLRSDWDHNGETAAYVSLGRDLDDLGFTGWHLSASYGKGWGGRAPNLKTELKEEAYAVDLVHTFGKGLLEGASLRLHYMIYNNQTDLPSWTGFKNAFEDERDLICILVIPFGPYSLLQEPRLPR